MKLGIVTIEIRWKRLRGVVCWMKDHVWEQFYAISVWHSQGRFCKRCGLQDVWRYEHDLSTDPATSYLVDSKGRRVSV